MAQGSSPFTSIGKSTYFVAIEQKAGTLQPLLVKRLARYDEDLIPCTAIEWTHATFAPSDLETACERFAAGDDVWSKSFLSREFATH